MVPSYLSTEFLTGSTFDSLLRSKLLVKREGLSLLVRSSSGGTVATVTQADLIGSAGVVHVIDAVLRADAANLAYVQLVHAAPLAPSVVLSFADATVSGGPDALTLQLGQSSSYFGMADGTYSLQISRGACDTATITALTSSADPGPLLATTMATNPACGACLMGCTSSGDAMSCVMGCVGTLVDAVAASLTIAAYSENAVPTFQTCVLRDRNGLSVACFTDGTGKWDSTLTAGNIQDQQELSVVGLVNLMDSPTTAMSKPFSSTRDVQTILINAQGESVQAMPAGNWSIQFSPAMRERLSVEFQGGSAYRVVYLGGATASGCITVPVIALGAIPVVDVPIVRKSLDILGIVKQTATLKTLALIIRAAGMDSELQTSSEASMCTLLAPSDSALSTIAPAEFARLMRPENVAELRQLLRFHLLTSAVRLPVDGAQVNTRAGGSILIESQDGSTVVLGKNRIRLATVSNDGQEATNGLVYVIDRVLPLLQAMPPMAPTKAPMEAASQAPSASTSSCTMTQLTKLSNSATQEKKCLLCSTSALIELQAMAPVCAACLIQCGTRGADSQMGCAFDSCVAASPVGTVTSAPKAGSVTTAPKPSSGGTSSPMGAPPCSAVPDAVADVALAVSGTLAAPVAQLVASLPGGKAGKCGQCIARANQTGKLDSTLLSVCVGE
jgi:uncharacterized surface protein with fasciclin (FAS1) repeats